MGAMVEGRALCVGATTYGGFLGDDSPGFATEELLTQTLQ